MSAAPSCRAARSSPTARHPKGVQTTWKASAFPSTRAASVFSGSLPRPAKAWMQIHVMPFSSLTSRGMLLTAPCSVSSLDNGGPAMSFRSEFLAAALALDPPQREQQVDLFIGERLALDLCEDGLKVGSDALARVGWRPGRAAS